MVKTNKTRSSEMFQSATSLTHTHRHTQKKVIRFDDTAGKSSTVHYTLIGSNSITFVSA